MSFKFQKGAGNILDAELFHECMQAEKARMHSETIPNISVEKTGCKARFVARRAGQVINSWTAFGDGTKESPFTSTKLHNELVEELAKEPERREAWARRQTQDGRAQK